jgi:N-glycosylase/DNA lyase
MNTQLPAVAPQHLEPATQHCLLPARNYDLAATLDSGQSFAWTLVGDAWEGVVNQCWIRLRQVQDGIEATTPLYPNRTTPGRVGPTTPPGTRETRPVSAADHAVEAAPLWLTAYLQSDLDLATIVDTFPPDAPLIEAVRCCGGLRILRQDPWECLASFLLSATKQIVQICQICATLRRRFGTPVTVPAGHTPAFSFPSAHTLAGITESDLRQCGMGFRARYLHQTARLVARGDLDLLSLRGLPLDTARTRLLELPGVGPKISECVLLFSCDQPRAFPIDVWVARALRRLYYQGRRVPARELLKLAANHFGPWAGHAQQFLFHYARRYARLTD